MAPRKSGTVPPSPAADTGCVDLIENLLLHLGVQRIGVVLIDRTQQRTLGEICRLIARAAQTDTDNDRRARVGAGMDARIRDEIHDLRLGSGRREHLHLGHILRAEALRCNRDLHLVTRNDRGVQDTRRVVARCFAAQRITDHRQAQIAVNVAAADTLVTASSNEPPVRCTS